jgi:hypothetical protein
MSIFSSTSISCRNWSPNYSVLVNLTVVARLKRGATPRALVSKRRSGWVNTLVNWPSPAEGEILDFGRLRDLTTGPWGKQVSINQWRSSRRAQSHGLPCKTFASTPVTGRPSLHPGPPAGSALFSAPLAGPSGTPLPPWQECFTGTAKRAHFLARQGRHISGAAHAKSSAS